MTAPCRSCGCDGHAAFACTLAGPPLAVDAPSWRDSIGCAPRCTHCGRRPVTPWLTPDRRPSCFDCAVLLGGATDA